MDIAANTNDPCRWPRNVSESNLSGGTAGGQGHYGKSSYTETGALMLGRRFFLFFFYKQTLMCTPTWRHWDNSKCFTLHFHSNYTKAEFVQAPCWTHTFCFPSTIVISPRLAGSLTAKVLMHTLPRSVILRASAQVLCCWHFVNLSPRQRQLEQSWCSAWWRDRANCAAVSHCVGCPFIIQGCCSKVLVCTGTSRQTINIEVEHWKPFAWLQ